MNRTWFRPVLFLQALLVVFAVLGVDGQQSATLAGGNVVDLAPMMVRDLVLKVTDLSGNPVDAIAGSVRDLQVEQRGNEIRIDLNADVLFDFDKADILPSAAATLKEAADIIRQRGAKGAVRIEGYTDSKGDDAYNMKLSLRRAESVRDWLVGKEGLTTVSFATQGFGKSQPVAPNTNPDGSDNPQGRAKNRRVTIVMKTS